jgi:hypothetical protein
LNHLVLVCWIIAIIELNYKYAGKITQSILHIKSLAKFFDTPCLAAGTFRCKRKAPARVREQSANRGTFLHVCENNPLLAESSRRCARPFRWQRNHVARLQGQNASELEFIRLSETVETMLELLYEAYRIK